MEITRHNIAITTANMSGIKLDDEEEAALLSNLLKRFAGTKDGIRKIEIIEEAMGEYMDYFHAAIRELSSSDTICRPLFSVEFSNNDVLLLCPDSDDTTTGLQYLCYHAGGIFSTEFTRTMASTARIRVCAASFSPRLSKLGPAKKEEEAAAWGAFYDVCDYGTLTAVAEIFKMAANELRMMYTTDEIVSIPFLEFVEQLAKILVVPEVKRVVEYRYA